MARTSGSASSGLIGEAIAEHRTWFIFLGGVMLALGIIAIAFPFVTTIAAKIFLGWLFLLGGIVQVVHAFGTQKWSQFFLSLLIGALYVLVGGWLAFYPLTGIITLTILLAITFILQGLIEAGMAFRMRPQGGWGWMLLSAIVAVLAGVLIIAGLPGTAVWVLGLLVGINLISSGWAYLFLAMAASKAGQ